MAPAVVRRIDHVPFAVNDPDELYSVFADVMGFPPIVPLAPYDLGTEVRGGSVWAGDFDLWVFGRGESVFAPNGIALEPVPLEQAVAELDRRGIAQLPRMHFDHGSREPLGRVTEDVVMVPGFGDEGTWVWLAEYGFEKMARDEARADLRALLDEANGGPLGITPGTELVLGATDVQSATDWWQKLLDPIQPVAEGCWRIGDGPSVRLVQSDRNRIETLRLRTKDIVRARQSLEAAGLLLAVSNDDLRLMPDRLAGLDVRLFS